jgi:hypothetical protein
LLPRRSRILRSRQPQNGNRCTGSTVWPA